MGKNKNCLLRPHDTTTKSDQLQVNNQFLPCLPKGKTWQQHHQNPLTRTKPLPHYQCISAHLPHRNRKNVRLHHFARRDEWIPFCSRTPHLIDLKEKQKKKRILLNYLYNKHFPLAFNETVQISLKKTLQNIFGILKIYILYNVAWM